MAMLSPEGDQARSSGPVLISMPSLVVRASRLSEPGFRAYKLVGELLLRRPTTANFLPSGEASRLEAMKSFPTPGAS